MSDNMACTHRAALKRCHELLQEAHAYVPENEAWHDQVTEILLPCDEAMECPTVPSAPAQQRDERIVRERGPWRAYFACVEPLGFTDLACDEEVTRANRAAARVLNRIAKSEGKP